MSEQKYDDVNRGIIGTNGFKQNDKQPDMSGRINIDGIWYYLSGWKNQKGGREYTSLAATIMTQDQVDSMMAKREAKNAPQQAASQPRQQPAAQPQAAAPTQTPPTGHPASEPPMDFDDDIPF